MDARTWQKIKYVFNSALEQPAANVNAYLDDVCGDDLELRAEVSRLLIQHLNVGDFLERPPVAPPPIIDASAEAAPVDGQFVGTDRFDILGRLGAGGFGEVYEAFDRHRRARVALKYLRRFEPESLYRLKREFRTLTDIRHPNVVQVFELFSRADPPFFTMELLTGCDLGQYFRDHWNAAEARPADYGVLRDYLLQLAQGLVALHQADIIHRDVKPSNVFLTESGRAVLLDFGVVKHLRSAATTFGIAGTPHYSAPEQLDGAPITSAADWYAVGALLFEALTGTTPFQGNVLDVLDRKRAEDPRRASDVVSGVPADLDRLCDALLQRDPRRRPGDLEVLGQLDAGAIAIESTVRVEPGTVFVGREHHLTVLQRAFDEAERGATACVHVRGPSGVGKTGLIKTFLDRLRTIRPECVVLHGRCYESEAAPHKGLDELVDRLAIFLKGLDAQRVASLLPRYFPLLTRLFPVLQQLHGASRGMPEIADPREQRYRALTCLRECLTRISESYPLVLWIDDLQWSDAETVRVLNDMLQPSTAFGCTILLSYRNDGDDAALAGLDQATRPLDSRISVTPLDVDNLRFEDARALALNLLRSRGDDGHADTAAEAIARESGGNPFFVAELARYLPARPDRQDLTAGAFGIGHVIKRRVALLPEPALRLLEVVAVAGQPLASDICVGAVRLNDDTFETRGLLMREHLIRTRMNGDTEELDVYHDQVRAAVCEFLSPQATGVYHGLLARELETTGSTDHERLLVHYEASGDRDKAIDHAMFAAREATEALAFDRAVKLLRRVIDLRGDRDHAILEQLGEALSNAGQGKDAAEAFLAASVDADDDRRLELRRRACEQYLRGGHLEEGMALIRTLLGDAGLRYPTTQPAVIWSLLWQRFRVAMQLRRLKAATRRSSENASPDTVRRGGTIMRLDVTWTCSVGMSMVDVARGAYFQGLYTTLALGHGDARQRSLGLAAELAMGSMDGKRRHQDTEWLFANAVGRANESASPHALAFAMSMRGIASWITGDWADCYEKNLNAATLFSEKCSGVNWELTTANTFALSAQVFLGRWREQGVTFPNLIQQAEARGDRYGTISLPLLGYTFVQSLRHDRPDDALAMLARSIAAWPYPQFQMQHCDALFGEVETYLYAGEPTRAVAAIARDWAALKRSHLLTIQYYGILMHALRARAFVAAAAVDPSRRDLLHVARRDAARLRRAGASWGVALAHVIQAGLATMDGRADTAESWLRAAERLFAVAQMSHYLAAARLRLSQLSTRSSPERDAAEQWMASEEIVAPDRLAAMLIPGRWPASHRQHALST